MHKKSLRPTVDPPVTFAIANVPVPSTAAEFWRYIFLRDQGMPVILYSLFFVSCMPILLAWIASFFRVKQFGKFDNNYPRIQQAQLTGVGARVQGAQMNSWEALIIYATVNFIAFASGLELNSLDEVAIAFALLRVLHAVFYIANLAWFRSGVFALSMFCCLYIVFLSATI